MNKAMKIRAAIGVALMSATTFALAEVPADVTTQVATSKADIIATGAVLLGVAVAVASVAWLRRVIR